MSNIQVIKWWLMNKQDNFLSWILEELEKEETKVGATEIASTIKNLLSATTLNWKWDVMDDNKARIDAVKLVLQLNGVKTSSWINVNLFNVSKPWIDQSLEY